MNKQGEIEPFWHAYLSSLQTGTSTRSVSFKPKYSNPGVIEVDEKYAFNLGGGNRTFANWWGCLGLLF
jgi:hypothetical protein